MTDQGRDALHRFTLRTALPEPVLATGGHFSSRVAIGVGRDVFVGPTIGDLSNADNWDAWLEQVERMQRTLGVNPMVVAHDLHPDYLTTRFAQRGGFDRLVPVQHHHAHVASLMIDNGIAGPVLGLAFDGTGFGADGGLWGGEFLLCAGGACQRLGTLAPIPLPGGEAAIKEPWRSAVALLDRIYGEDVPWDRLNPAFRAIPEADRRLVAHMARTGLNTVSAHGLGRYFDVIASLGLGLTHASHGGALPQAWEAVADPDVGGRYSFTIDLDTAPATLDLFPTLRDAISELVDGVDAAAVSARFHRTVAAGAASLAMELRGEESWSLGLTGGCFLNSRLTSELQAALGGEGRALVHRRVPSSDAGISVGQILVSASVLAADAGMVLEQGCPSPTKEVTR